MNKNILELNETIKILKDFLKDLKKCKYIVILNESSKLFISINFYLNEMKKDYKNKSILNEDIKINNHLITDIIQSESLIMKSNKRNIKNCETFLKLLNEYKLNKIMN